MLSLGFGLAAALAWAVHDLLVRKLSQDTALLPMLFFVLAAGSVALTLPALTVGGWETMGPQALVPAAAAGLAFVAGCGGLYQALSRAPVRFVAPVLGAYPLLSVAIAAIQGSTILASEWLAVTVIVIGIGWVAVSGHAESGVIRGGIGRAMGWAAIGAMGFAAAFALGQEATRQGSELPSMVITRLTALLAVALLCLMWRAPMRLPWSTARVVMVMGVLDAAALGLVMVSGRLPNPEYASVASALFGVLTILLAWMFLKETVKPAQWPGIAAVFLGIAALSAQG